MSRVIQAILASAYELTMLEPGLLSAEADIVPQTRFGIDAQRALGQENIPRGTGHLAQKSRQYFQRTK